MAIGACFSTKSDFVDESPNEGSLWASDGQTNYYFTKNKIRSIGDIVTLTLEDSIVKDMGIDAKRSLSQNERETEMNLAQDRIRAKYMGDSVASTAAAPDRTPAATPSATPGTSTDPNAQAQSTQTSTQANQKKPDDAPLATYNDVDVGKSLELKSGDTMMAEIVERYPNGNYKIRGLKRVPYKNGPPRLVSVVGVVQNSDIDEAGSIKSSKLYEYKLQSMRQ